MTRPLSNLNLALNRSQGAGGGFSPIDIPNLTCWLDAQDNSSLTLISGNQVQTWASRVSPVSTFDGPTGQRPLTVTVNGLQMLQFDGINDILVGQAQQGNLQPGSADFAVVQVYRSTNAGNGLIWWKDDGAGKRWLIRVQGGTDSIFSLDDNTVAQNLIATDVDFTNDDIYVVFCERDGTNLRFYYGNGGVLSESAVSPVSIGAYGDLGLGQTLIGAEAQVSPTQPLDGDIGEMFFYKQALSSAERNDLYSYLVGKWSL